MDLGSATQFMNSRDRGYRCKEDSITTMADSGPLVPSNSELSLTECSTPSLRPSLSSYLTERSWILQPAGYLENWQEDGTGSPSSRRMQRTSSDNNGLSHGLTN